MDNDDALEVDLETVLAVLPLGVLSFSLDREGPNKAAVLLSNLPWLVEHWVNCWYIFR